MQEAEEGAIWSRRVVLEQAMNFAPHTHARHELVWARGGTMTVRLLDRTITVPEGYGVWIPAGFTHAGATHARAELYDAHFDPERISTLLSDPSLVEVTPLLAALLQHLEQPRLAPAERLRAEAVVADVLVPAPQQLMVRVPTGTRIDAVVAALLEDPGAGMTLAGWAEHLLLSERTVARLFRTHTGLSFARWRQILRTHRALVLLGQRLSVAEVSERLGYAQPSTFIAAFKRVMGVTPGVHAAVLAGGRAAEGKSSTSTHENAGD